MSFTRGIVICAMKFDSRCYKYQLPNGKIVDILSNVIDEISPWLQLREEDPESGGYILGYQHYKTNNITLEFVTSPQKNDLRSRVRFVLRDLLHNKIMRSASKNKSYYMGVWHTHPQTIPCPSDIDLRDWVISMKSEKTASNYIFFIIAGTEEIRIWVGDFKTKNIVEIFEKNIEDGIYVRE